MSRKSRTDFSIIDSIAWAQGGLVSSRQLAEAAISTSTVRHRIRSGGPWRRVLPTVYQLSVGSLTPGQREQAALLYAGPDAALTGLAAMRRHRIRYLPDDPVTAPVHLLLPHHRRVHSTGFVLIERTRRMPLIDPSMNLPTVPLARAIVDSSRRCLHRGSVRAMASEAVQDGRVTIDALARELAQSQRRGSALLRDTLEDLVSGTRSAPEAQLRDLILAAGIREPLWNPTLMGRDGRFVCVPDGYYEDVGVALEVNSQEYHAFGEAFEATELRQAGMAGIGILVVPITPRRLRYDKPGIANNIESTLRHAQGRTPPDVIVEPINRFG